MVGDGRISVEMTAWCSTCENWIQESSPTKRCMTTIAIGRGWQKRAGLWVCPRCIEDATPEQEEQDG